jgi:hypothetical protein
MIEGDAARLSALVMERSPVHDLWSCGGASGNDPIWDASKFIP